MIRDMAVPGRGLAILGCALGWSMGLPAAPAHGQELTPGVIPEVPPAECLEADDRIAVLLVGSYHMSNPGADQFNLEADDVLTPRRQEEILAVVESLAEFAPTRVAIEAPWGDTLATSRYRAYLAGTGELRRSEEEQIGFRLAEAMGHETVYPIDVRIGLPGDRLESVLEAEPELGRYMAGLEAWGEWAVASMAKWLADGSVGAMLARMNTPEAISWADRGYFEFFLPLVVEDNYGGAEFVATWYERNLKIFSNLHRISEPGDRVLVLYGAGHIPHLRRFVTFSPHFCLADPLDYLQP
jgi:hypothetical protein